MTLYTSFLGRTDLPFCKRRLPVDLYQFLVLSFLLLFTIISNHLGIFILKTLKLKN